MKTPLKYTALFFAVYSIFLITTVPATWVMSFVSLPKNVEISQLTGSVWHSHIEQVSANNVVINDIELDLSVLSLFTLNPTVDVSFGGGISGSALAEGPRGEVRLTNLLGEITAEAGTIKVDAQFVVEQVKLPVDIEAHNQLTLTLNSYTLGKPYCKDLSGNLSWPKAAATGFNETVDVGALKVKLGCTKGNIEVSVVKNNNLGLSFTGILARNNRFSGQGYLQPGSKFPKKLEGVLGFLGKKDGKGRYALKL